MEVGTEVLSKVSADGLKRRLRGMVPLGCLLLTCCMGETVAVAREDVEPKAKPVAVAAAEALPVPDASEAALLLAEKSSKFDSGSASTKVEKSKSKRKSAAAEEEPAKEEAPAEAKAPKASTGFRAKSIQADFDNRVQATLKEVVVRGSVLTATVTLSFQSSKEAKESEYLSTSLEERATHLLDYDSGTTYPIKKLDGFTSGRLNSQQAEKTLRATFEAPPKSVKAVGVTIYHVGTFDDVMLGGSKATPGAGKTIGGDASKDVDEEDTEEEDADEDEDEEEEADTSSLGQKKKK